MLSVDHNTLIDKWLNFLRIAGEFDVATLKIKLELFVVNTFEWIQRFIQKLVKGVL